MAHNIFGNNIILNKEPAWHKLGYVLKEETSAVQGFTMLEGYYIEKRPVKLFMNNEWIETGDFGLVRSPVPSDPTERNFGFVTKQYQIIQPLRICELFDENVKAAVETLGMLGKGERLFLTWKLPQIDVKGDIFYVYGFVAVGYDGKFGATLYVVTVRVVCQNTWSIAVSEAANTKEEGRGRIWTGKHNSENLERDLGIWMAHVQETALAKIEATKNQFVAMAEKPITVDEAFGLLNKIYEDAAPLPAYFPAKLRDEKQAKIDAQNRKAKDDRDAAMALFKGTAGIGIDASAYGLFNSCTQLENYRESKKAPEVSILMGERSKSMTRAHNVIMDWVVAPEDK